MRLFSRTALAAALLAAGASVHATTVTSQATWLADQQWRLSFTISNDSLVDAIEGWTVNFDGALFTGLAAAVVPPGWDPLLFQPDHVLAAPGAFDVLADPGAELQPGDVLGGFSLIVTWLGAGAPGSLPFEVYRLGPDGEVDIVERGRTSVSTVPVPATLLLSVAGIALLAGLRRRQGRASQAMGVPA